MNHLGAIVALAVPVVTVVGAVVLWVAVWGPIVKNARALMRTQSAPAMLREGGLPVRARILGVRPTGHMTNFTPQCQIDMDVYFQDALSYRVSVA